MSLLAELDALYLDHRRCGELDAGVEGVVIWFDCECGARIAQRADDGTLAAGAVLATTTPILFRNRTSVAQLARKARLPTMFALGEFVEAGGLLAYGASLTSVYADAAGYVDKIVRGAKPADLPVEQPTKFDLVINLKTAKALSLTIPPSLLARADQVIE